MRYLQERTWYSLTTGVQACHYMSKALTKTEQRHLNIERELLAIVFALERLNHYTFGRTITVQSDHQPLQSIWKKSIVSASPRLQRLLLRLAHYDLNRVSQRKRKHDY